MDQLSQLPPIVWALIAAAVAFGFLLSLAWRWYRRYRARKALQNAVIAGTMDHLVDALVPDGMGGGYHVDYLLLTQRGVVVIDLRDVRGNIFGADQMAEWTVMDGPHRFTFTNPQGALYDRIAAVKAAAGEVAVEGTHRVHPPGSLSQGPAQVDADARWVEGGVSERRRRRKLSRRLAAAEGRGQAQLHGRHEPHHEAA